MTAVLRKNLYEMAKKVENALCDGWDFKNVTYEGNDMHALYFTAVHDGQEIEIMVDYDYYASNRDAGTEDWYPMDDIYPMECNE